MAASVITSSSAASVTFGATAETGIILSSFNRSVQGQKAELMDEDGDIVAISTYGRTATISISGAINGSSGVATASVGSLLTIANATTEFGVTGGKIAGHAVTVYLFAPGENKLWAYDFEGSTRVRAFIDNPTQIATQAEIARGRNTRVVFAEFLN